MPARVGGFVGGVVPFFTAGAGEIAGTSRVLGGMAKAAGAAGEVAKAADLAAAAAEATSLPKWALAEIGRAHV